MDTRRTLRRAWEITRQYSWLWILGLFLAGMGSGNVDLAVPVAYNVPGTVALSVPTVMGVVFVAGVLAVAGVALWVAGAVARGALIHAVAQVALDEEAFSLRKALAAGVVAFGRIFLIGLPVAIPALLLTFSAYTAALSGLANAGDASALGMVRAILLPLSGLLVLLSLGLTLVQHFADRAALLEGLGPLAALRRGWGLLARHWRNLRGIVVIWAALTIGLRLLLAVPTTGLILPVVFAGIAGRPLESAALTIVALAGFVTVMVFLLLAVGNVFAVTVWTLVYRDLLALEAADAQSAPRPGTGPVTNRSPHTADAGRSREETAANR